MTDMGKEKLLEWLNLFHSDYLGWNPGDIEGAKKAYTQLVKIVEESFNDKHLIPMGNGASQCKYCGASFLPSYTEESDG